MNGDDTSNGRNGMMMNVIYRSALLGICGWVLLAVLANNDRSIKMESDIHYFNTSVSRIEGNLNNLVTKPELELTVIKLKNDALTFQNEFMKLTHPQALVPSLNNKHTGR
jgi:hypothetical protein